MLVPNPEDREQGRRAEFFSQRGLARAVSEGALSPGLLASVVSEAMDAPKSIRRVKIDGEVAAERILSDLLMSRRRGTAA